MAVSIEWPDQAAWEQQVELDGEIYILKARYVEPFERDPFWLLDLLTDQEEPIELGMVLTGGRRFAWRNRDPLSPPGALLLQVVNGLACPDLPTYDCMVNGEVILAYLTEQELIDLQEAAG